MPNLIPIRTMIVEDDILLALDLADALRGAGHEIIGPFSSVDAALKGVNADRPQIAILDIDLNGHLSFPVADALARKNVPFLWLSASSPEIVPERYRVQPFLSKPFATHGILRVMANLLTTS
jgi:DNA-binding response OmpR family regulator